MASLADLENLMLTHQCKLFYGDPVADTNKPEAAPAHLTATKVVALDNLEFGKTTPERRINFGISRAYFHAAPDIDIAFTIRSTSLEALAFIKTRDSYSTAGIKKQYPWTFICKDTKATASKTVRATAHGKIIDSRWIKPSDDQTIPLSQFVRIRVTSNDVNMTNVA